MYFAKTISVENVEGIRGKEQKFILKMLGVGSDAAEYIGGIS